jgi:hypothetical protein
MSEILSKLDNNDIIALCGILVGVIAVVGGIMVAITTVVVAYLRRSRLDDMEATLKLEMLQRGMSAEEIKAVLETSLGKPATTRHAWWGGCAPGFAAHKFGKACK